MLENDNARFIAHAPFGNTTVTSGGSAVGNLLTLAIALWFEYASQTMKYVSVRDSEASASAYAALMRLF